MDILESVIPVFLVVAVGAGARAWGFLDEPFVRTGNALVYWLLLPVLLFLEIGSSSFRESFRPEIVVGAYAATGAVFLLAVLLSRTRLCGTPGARGAFVMGAVRANLAYVGLPIVYNLSGRAGLAKAGILLGFLVPLLNALAIIALLVPHGEGKRPRQETLRRVASEIVRNPIIIASFQGVVWSLFALPVPGVLRSTLRILSQATLPLSLLCLGASITFERARSGLGAAATAAALKIVVLAAVGILLYRAMGLGGDDLRIGAVMLGCPAAVVTYVMASQLKGDVDLAGTIVIVSTAASAVTISGWLFLLKLLGW